MFVPPLWVNVDCRNWKRPMYGPRGLYALGRIPDSQRAIATIQSPEMPWRAAAARMMPSTELGSTGPVGTLAGCARGRWTGAGAGAGAAGGVIGACRRSIMGWL